MAFLLTTEWTYIITIYYVYGQQRGETKNLLTCIITSYNYSAKTSMIIRSILKTVIDKQIVLPISVWPKTWRWCSLYSPSETSNFSFNTILGNTLCVLYMFMDFVRPTAFHMNKFGVCSANVAQGYLSRSFRMRDHRQSAVQGFNHRIGQRSRKRHSENWRIIIPSFFRRRASPVTKLSKCYYQMMGQRTHGDLIYIYIIHLIYLP